MANLYKLQFNNRTILTPSKDSFVAFVEPPVAYKRYMWKFTGATGRLGYRQFQMAAIKINDESLPYTYITSAISVGSTWGDGSATNFIDLDETNKWGGGSESFGTIDGWIIFDLPSAIVPVYYMLKTANDTEYENRNPTGSLLYASLDTPTTSTDSSWVLLDDRNPNLPRSNLTWCGPYTLNQI